MRLAASGKMRQVIALSVLFLCWIAAGAAQTGTSTGLNGRVTDTSGTLVPGAVIAVSNVETGEERSTASAGDGTWEVRALSPGMYRVEIEKAGFRRLVRSGVRVTSFEMAALDLRLELGELQQTVEVEGDAEMVRADSATSFARWTRKSSTGCPPRRETSRRCW